VTVKQRIGRWLFARLPVTRWMFDQLRFEANAWLVSGQNRVLPARRRALARVRALRGALVNVACGPQILDGFVNVDLLGPPPRIRWDCRRSLPFADAAVAGIRAEQFVEHLDSREELPDFLRDCLRALEPGGVLRVIVPDARRYLQAYCRPGLEGFRELGVPDPFPGDLPTRMDVVNHIFHQWGEHRWAYDFEALALRLRTAGFDTIEQVGYQRSLLPALARDRDVHARYSLYVDAVKHA
jgi:predicted SAM-dependent methyltransferase